MTYIDVKNGLLCIPFYQINDNDVACKLCINGKYFYLDKYNLTKIIDLKILPTAEIYMNRVENNDVIIQLIEIAKELTQSQDIYNKATNILSKLKENDKTRT